MNNKFNNEIPDWLKYEFFRYAYSVMPELSIAEMNGFIENAWYVKISGGTKYQINILSRDTWSQEINDDVYLYSMYEEISVDAPDASGWISPRGEEIPGSEITFLERRDSKKTFSFIQPSNEIWYKTISGEPLIPSNPDRLPEIIFNENGIMRFASPLTEITGYGNSVFYGCSDLLEISFPGSLLTIQQGLFGGNCPNLKKITINNGTTTISSYSLNQLRSLEEVEIKGETLTDLGSGAFQYNASLKKINIPDSVTEIESYAFQGCSSLGNLKLPKNLKSIRSSAFYQSSVKFDNGVLVIPDSVEILEGSAFAFTTGIKKFVVNPESSLTSLSSYAFNSSNLEEVEILKDLNLQTYQGYFGSNLKKATICAENVQNILGSQYNLETLVLIGTKTIASGAFSNSYSKLKTVIFPEGLVSIGDGSFPYSGLFPIKLPKSVKTIGNSAFNSPSGQGKRIIVLNEGLEEIGNQAFSSSKVDTIIIPSTVKTIGSSAFYGSGATRIEIRGIPDSIGSGCFSYSGNIELSNFVCSDSLNAKENHYWGATVYDSELPGGILVESGKVVSVKNPDKISGDIILPDTITGIGSNAFYGCSKITSISGAGVTAIEASSFYGCSSLSEIDFPEITYFGDHSLNNTSIKSITFGENVETIGTSLLSGSPVKQITIESEDVSIGSSSFYGLYLSEDDITYPSGLTGYPWGATIVDVTEDGLMVKNGVLYGYRGDTPLVTLDIPSTVTSINYSTVGIKVPTLKKVIFNSAISLGYTSPFQNIPSLKEVEGIEIVRTGIGFASFSGSGCQVVDGTGNYILGDTWLTGMIKSGELIVSDGIEDFCTSQFFDYSGSFPSEITIRIPDSVKALRNNTFGISELSTSSRTFNIYIGSGVETIESTPLPQSTSSKATITLNVYTSNQVVKDFLATYGNSYTIVNIYEPNID